MKIKLLILTLILSLCITFVACNTKENKMQVTQAPFDAEVVSYDKVRLLPTEDRGMSYIDSFIFIGESTTYHLKNRGVLSGGQNTKQIWSPASGTMTLDMSASKIKIVYPETNEEISFYEAARRTKPSYIMMTFGLNGAVQNINRGEEYFKTCYKNLIKEIQKGAPDTKIILGSAFPVAENMDVSRYSVDVKTLNQYIDIINSWTQKLCAEENCKYLDTSEILKDENNNLKLEYQSGDGYHLTKEAYIDILYYIRTHGYS